MLVESCDFPQVMCVRRIGHVRGQSGTQGIVNGDADIEDCRLRVLMEVFIDTDGIWDLDRRE